MSANASREYASIGRRAALINGSLILTSAACGVEQLSAGEIKPSTRIGLVTDLHYADKPSAGTRHYKETLDKLTEAAEHIEQHEPDFIVELGDFIDAADMVATELGYLKRINRDFSAICKQRHYVLGNHCVHTLNKQEFLEAV
ncbi:MAG: metallophosphoesterase [Planctomycetota bacterium]